VRDASSGGDLKLCIRVNGSRSVEQSGGVCVPVVDVVAGRGRLESAGYKVAAATGLAVEFRAFRRGSSRAVVGALARLWKGVCLAAHAIDD
jgi:hypothetical protein